MGTLGYDVVTGFVYEGPEEPCFPIWPTPVVSYATLLSSPLDEQNIPYGGTILQSTWLFREDSYDPVSRVRRGRLFEPRSGLDPRPIRVEPHPASHGDLKHVHHEHGRLRRTLQVYLDCLSFNDIREKGVGLRLALGIKPIYTIWKIVQTELTIQEDVLVTLRAESTFGILPEIRKDIVPPTLWARIEAALNRVADSAHKELPTSVVDQCRQAAAEIIGCWLKAANQVEHDIEIDLGPWIKRLAASEIGKERYALRDAANIINALHPRGKPNEIARIGLRTVAEDDATTAIHLIGFILREVGWARDV